MADIAPIPDERWWSGNPESIKCRRELLKVRYQHCRQHSRAVPASWLHTLHDLLESLINGWIILTLVADRRCDKN